MTQEEKFEPDINDESALKVIALELRYIRRVLEAMAFDPDAKTVLHAMHMTLEDTLQTNTDPNDRSIAANVQRVAVAIEEKAIT